MRQLRGKNALLTGASRGLGPYLARTLAAEGVNLALSATRLESIQELAASLEQEGVKATPLTADFTVAPDVASLAERAEEALQGIDILVNNAGIESEGLFMEQDPDTIIRTVRVNCTAPMRLTHLLLPAMVRRGEGHIVNMSSIAGKRGAPYDAIYSGTKAALIEWGNALRMELADTGVFVSTICPGYVTEVGMFARFGIDPPRLIGSCTPQQVAAATVRAIKLQQPEVIVNSRPLRPLLAFGQLFPTVADRMLRAAGIPAFQKRKVGRG
ncbi:MAG: SDR family NAD(P)-dependent oxidoreductase [Gemmatimonadota bacterium]|nr:MAG: SDR family NAD(P)-dependent oxidoreductase [Gemmatimonadota bacterium]